MHKLVFGERPFFTSLFQRPFFSRPSTRVEPDEINRLSDPDPFRLRDGFIGIGTSSD